jgi:hypothetical protein
MISILLLSLQSALRAFKPNAERVAAPKRLATLNTTGTGTPGVAGDGLSYPRESGKNVTVLVKERTDGGDCRWNGKS